MVSVEVVVRNLHKKFNDYRWKHNDFRSNVKVLDRLQFVTLTFDLLTWKWRDFVEVVTRNLQMKIDDYR